ncbi:hypothetical protein [Leifsonia sp. AG29]|uniref:hypothetical protein n=1 Tax=Leifsonia sp. AG29 TaxID=2598860 RepID=UPI00131E561A|nr:hypothetical protein [Leifsonia sp. AG29]
MARMTDDEVRERLAALEAENAALRGELERASTGAALDAGAASAPPAAPAAPHKRSWAWTLLSVVLIVIGSVLAPVAVVASWAKVQLTDTDTFVATYAPLADDPAVQSYVTDQVVTVVQQKVDIPKLTSQVIDGITGLGTGPVATKALNALKEPMAQGIVSLLHDTVANFVRSDTFKQVWQEALRATHKQFVATMQNNPQSAVTIGANGSIGIQLGPIIERVKQALIDRGLTFASQIPAVNPTVTVAQKSSVPTLQLLYGVALAAGSWLPWIAIGFLALGVVVARRRALALVWASIGLALAMLVVLALVGTGRLLFQASVTPSLMPSAVAQTLYGTVSDAMRDTAIAVLVLAIAVALVGWYAGPFAFARRLRGFFGSGVAWVRNSAESHGITTGRTGEWLYAQRALLRAAVAVIASAVILFVRPLTPALIIWTLVIAALVIAVLELVQRPAVAVPQKLDEDTPAMTVS